MLSNSTHLHHPPAENRAVYEIMLKNMVQSERPLMTIIRRMRTACWVTKFTEARKRFSY